VARLREHVERLHGRDLVPGGVERQEVAHLRLRVARDVDDRARRELEALVASIVGLLRTRLAGWIGRHVTGVGIRQAWHHELRRRADALLGELGYRVVRVDAELVMRDLAAAVALVRRAL